MSLAVLTIAHGRHDHLRGLLDGLRRSERRPDLVVVAAMDDDRIAGVVGECWDGPAIVRPVPADPRGLPLAAARNEAARSAIDAGAETLVFLDVDCIPSPSLTARYEQTVAAGEGCAVFAGEVAYLPEAERPYRPDRLAQLSEPHPARPVLAADATTRADDLTLFWSLSFALRARTWQALGGFDEDYVGYGGEDTDFASRIGTAGGTLTWVGGARAYHQFHENRMPPVHHLDDIVRNARIFRGRWGWWPMRGWLEEFDRRGLVTFDGELLQLRGER